MKVGDKFIVKETCNVGVEKDIKGGTIVTLIDEETCDIPLFRLPDGRELCILPKRLEPVSSYNKLLARKILDWVMRIIAIIWIVTALLAAYEIVRNW